jgi:hypothetical protein
MLSKIYRPLALYKNDYYCNLNPIGFLFTPGNLQA